MAFASSAKKTPASAGPSFLGESREPFGAGGGSAAPKKAPLRHERPKDIQPFTSRTGHLPGRIRRFHMVSLVTRAWQRSTTSLMGSTGSTSGASPLNNLLQATATPVHPARSRQSQSHWHRFCKPTSCKKDNKVDMPSPGQNDTVMESHGSPGLVSKN